MLQRDTNAFSLMGNDDRFVFVRNSLLNKISNHTYHTNEANETFCMEIVTIDIIKHVAPIAHEEASAPELTHIDK